MTRPPHLLLLLALPAFATAQVQLTSDYLLKIDTNGDGRIALLEYQDWMSYAFDGMDRDHDGVLSSAEQPGGKGQALTRDAHRARLAARFYKQDSDHDGFLNTRELAAPPQ